MLLLVSELSGSKPPVSSEAFNEMAAVGKARFLTDIVYVVIGEKEIFLRLVNPHVLNVFLAAHAVMLTEFLCKAGIAHAALLGNIAYLQIIIDRGVDKLGDIIYPVAVLGRNVTAVDYQTLIEPASYYAHKQPVNMGLQHYIKAVAVIINLVDALGKHLAAVHFFGSGGVKKNAHIIFPGISENAPELWCIGRGHGKSADVKFQHKTFRKRPVCRIYGMDGRGVKDYKIPLAENIGLVIGMKLRFSFGNVDKFGKIVPVGLYGKVVLCSVIFKAFHRCIEIIAFFKKSVHFVTPKIDLHFSYYITNNCI